MPNDSTDQNADIQIKTVGASSQGAAASSSTASTSQQPPTTITPVQPAVAVPAAAAPLAPQPIALEPAPAAAPAAAGPIALDPTPAVVAPAAAPATTQPIALEPAPTAAAPAPAAPVNTRAFNLEADVATSTTGMAVPEKFVIPKMVRDKYPDLVDLIKNTESMDDQERQYWFQILPIMTDDQVEKFKNILITEKQQLAELDKEYEAELNKLNEKHLIEWKEFESKEKNRAIKEAEAQNEASEKEQEEALLAKLSDV